MSEDQRLRYLADAVNTASPAQLVVMLYDRLGLDIERAASIQESGTHFESLEHLRHGQQIIAELLATLNVDAWDGADDLAALYGFLLRELIAGGAGPEVRRLRGAGTIVSDLRSSWYEAGQQLVGDISPVAAAGNAPASVGAWVA